MSTAFFKNIRFTNLALVVSVTCLYALALVAKADELLPSEQEQPQTIALQVGDLELIETETAIRRIAIGNGTVVEARQLGDNELLLVGLSEGYSQLRVWTEEAELRFIVQLGPLVTSSESTPVIELEVQVVEFKSRNLQSLGIRWQQMANGPNVGMISDWVGGDHFRLGTQGFDALPALSSLSLPAGHYAYAGISTALSSQLHVLSEQGEARMLATPVLRTESGQAAEFLAGGEVPLPQTNAQGAMDVTFRSYGISLQILPEQLDDGAIRTQVVTEVSSLDPAVSVQGIPGLLTRRTESVVAVPAGQTFVISGLRSEDQAQAQAQLPGLAEVPLVGSLFRQREQQRSETELVIFITPRVVNEDVKRQQQRHERVEQIQQALFKRPCQGMQSYL